MRASKASCHIPGASTVAELLQSWVSSWESSSNSNAVVDNKFWFLGAFVQVGTEIPKSCSQKMNDELGYQYHLSGCTIVFGAVVYYRIKRRDIRREREREKQDGLASYLPCIVFFPSGWGQLVSIPPLTPKLCKQCSV